MRTYIISLLALALCAADCEKATPPPPGGPTMSGQWVFSISTSTQNNVGLMDVSQVDDSVFAQTMVADANTYLSGVLNETSLMLTGTDPGYQHVVSATTNTTLDSLIGTWHAIFLEDTTKSTLFDLFAHKQQ